MLNKQSKISKARQIKAKQIKSKKGKDGIGGKEKKRKGDETKGNGRM